MRNTLSLIELLAIRLSPQAGKSLFIRRRPESSQTKNPHAAGRIFGFVRYAELLNRWIPACAGMTEGDLSCTAG